jgi:hypothetical protein
MESLYILRFTRCPREFRDALLEGPLLQDCQASMMGIGLEAEMPSGSKIFVKPELHKNAMEAVQTTLPNMQDWLRPYHVIVTEEFRPAVLKVVNGLPRGLKVKCKEEFVIARVSDSQWVSVDCPSLDRLPSKERKEALAETLPGPVEAPATTERQPTKTRKQKKSKGAAKASAQGADLEIGPLFDDIIPSFPLTPVDPMVALSFMNPMFTPMLQEQNWSNSYLLRQAMQEQQAMLTEAIACQLQAQAQRMMFENMVQPDAHLDGGIPLEQLQ